MLRIIDGVGRSEAGRPMKELGEESIVAEVRMPKEEEAEGL